MSPAISGDIEELVLSGKLFNPSSRSTSPVRSRSPSPAAWPNDDQDYDYDSDAERQRTLDQLVNGSSHNDSIGLGVPGRTGVKGVIRDRNEAASNAKAKRAQDINALNRAMEKASLGGKTWAEEERDRLAEQARLGDGPSGKESLLIKGRFGHLREVGVRGFVQAVEQEDRSTWVIVHIYDPSLDRCAALDDTLSRLARIYTSVKFLRARAGALGFASSTSTSSRSHLRSHNPPFSLQRSSSRKMVVPGRYPDDEDDESGEDRDEEVEDEGWEDDAVDTDVLPTLLAYRAGDLVHSWIRVDWEAKLGIEEFLRRHHVLADAGSAGNCGLPSDDEDLDDLDDGELVFSDEGQ